MWQSVSKQFLPNYSPHKKVASKQISLTFVVSALTIITCKHNLLLGKIKWVIVNQKLLNLAAQILIDDLYLDAGKFVENYSKLIRNYKITKLQNHKFENL